MTIKSYFFISVIFLLYKTGKNIYKEIKITILVILRERILNLKITGAAAIYNCTKNQAKYLNILLLYI